MKTNRQKLEDTLAGQPVEMPVFAVYDWFVENRSIDWQMLFNVGLSKINHAYVVEYRRPNVHIIETTRQDASGNVRKDVQWITDIGELHEWYLGEWRQEYLIKQPEDYRILAHAFSDTELIPNLRAFDESENSLNDNGITLACPALRRTAFQTIQIDYAGLERFCLDVAMKVKPLFELIELMNNLLCREIELMAKMPIRHVKLWENLSIEIMGAELYRQYLMPTYKRIIEILNRNNQKLHLHYDGKLRLIADDIASLDFYGLDSLTPPPEGDITIKDARSLWPAKFFWLHPPLGWYQLSEKYFLRNIKQMILDAGPQRFCLMISEEVPPEWERTVPLLLETLR
jgi:hypothetical protein